MTIMVLASTLIGCRERMYPPKATQRVRPIKGWWKEVHLADVKIVIIETPKSIPSTFRDLGPLWKFHNT